MDFIYTAESQVTFLYILLLFKFLPMNMNHFLILKKFSKKKLPVFPILFTKILNTHVLLTKNNYKKSKCNSLRIIITNCHRAYSPCLAPLPSLPISHSLHYRHSATSTCKQYTSPPLLSPELTVSFSVSLFL